MTATSPVGDPGSGRTVSVYDFVGGMPFFEQLVRHFYVQVEADEVLLSLYPDPEDLEPARERLWLFLAQYFGGPATYSEQRGHPRLRARHLPFHIDPVARDRWLAGMRWAIDQMDCEPAVDAALWQYFAMAAEAMRNAE